MSGPPEGEQQIPIRMSEQLARSFAAAFEKYGDDVIEFAWIKVFEPMLPLAFGLCKAQDIFQQASEHHLSPEAVSDAIALVAMLKGSDDPHKAWRAAEIMLRYSKDSEKILAAARVPDGKPT